MILFVHVTMRSHIFSLLWKYSTSQLRYVNFACLPFAVQSGFTKKLKVIC